LYDLKAHELNLNRLNEAEGLWAHNANFSEVLRAAVLLLLNLNPERRLNCTELAELLSKHAEHITKK
jgi:hypothetical protein